MLTLIKVPYFVVVRDMKRNSGRPKKYFYFGLDAGNGSIKIVSDQFEERIPSYKTDNYLIDSRGSVQVEGIGFTVGRSALLGTNFYKRTVDDKFAKVEDLEALYLGALAHYPCPSVMHNRLVLSSHAYSTLKHQIKAKLEKPERVVVLAGNSVKLTTEVLLIVPEGFGAIYQEKGDIASLDFGNGTTVLTPYSHGKPGEPIIEHYGVQHLIRLISRSMSSINGGYPGDVDDIRRALERGDFKVDNLSIKDIYKQCLSTWWIEGLTDIIHRAAKLSQDGDRIICIGGGVALPGFSKILSSKGFVPVKDHPEMANARGLYQLALLRGNAHA